MYMRAHRLTEEKHWPCEYALEGRVEERREDEKIQECDTVDHPYLPDLARADGDLDHCNKNVK